jgi:hypothetical protein
VALVDGVATWSTSSLSHAIHTITAEYPGNLNLIGTTNSLTQVVNTLPVAGDDVLERLGASPVKVSIASLMSNDVDADGDPLSFLDVSPTSVHGGTLTIREGWIHYTPPAGFTDDDSFTYTISDGFGTPVAGIVMVVTYEDNDLSCNLTVNNLGNGSCEIRGDGIPGRTYQIEFMLDALNESWQWLGTVAADQFGVFRFIDTSGVPARIYRSVSP